MTVAHQKQWRPSLLLRCSLFLHIGALIIFIAAPEYWLPLLMLVIFNHLAIAAIGLWPRSSLLGSNWITLPAAAITRNEIALTIDDGPDPLVTPQVLEVLDQLNVVATFFCIGENARRHPELCREIVRRGHAVENHSLRHRHTFSVRGYNALRREISAAQTVLTELSGSRPQFFRAPAGLRNPFLDPVLTHCDLQLAAWTRRGFDTRVRDPAVVLKKLTRNLQAGDILLLHDGHAARTANGVPIVIAVLPALVSAIRAVGLTPVTLRDARAPQSPREFDEV